MKRVFIDGSAGTTGLRIRERLADRRDLELVILTEETRKDVSARRDVLNAADVAFLCLPDSEEGYTIRLWDDATAIRAIANGQWTGDDETYDLSGRKVANGNRLNGKSKGIFITNGKKVLK